MSGYSTSTPRPSAASPETVSALPVSQNNNGNSLSDLNQDDDTSSSGDHPGDMRYSQRNGSNALSDTETDANASLTSQALNADGTPKRPMNAFMIFARRRRPQVSAANSMMRTGEISKILSKEWNSMPMSDKQFYLDQAKKLKDNFNSKYPDYVYKRRPNNSRKKRRPDPYERPYDPANPGELGEDGYEGSVNGEFDEPSPTDGDHPQDALSLSELSFKTLPSQFGPHTSSYSSSSSISTSRSFMHGHNGSESTVSPTSYEPPLTASSQSSATSPYGTYRHSGYSDAASDWAGFSPQQQHQKPLHPGTHAHNNNNNSNNAHAHGGHPGAQSHLPTMHWHPSTSPGSSSAPSSGSPPLSDTFYSTHPYATSEAAPGGVHHPHQHHHGNGGTGLWGTNGPGSGAAGGGGAGAGTTGSRFGDHSHGHPSNHHHGHHSRTTSDWGMPGQLAPLSIGRQRSMTTNALSGAGGGGGGGFSSSAVTSGNKHDLLLTPLSPHTPHRAWSDTPSASSGSSAASLTHSSSILGSQHQAQQQQPSAFQTLTSSFFPGSLTGGPGPGTVDGRSTPNGNARDASHPYLSSAHHHHHRQDGSSGGSYDSTTGSLAYPPISPNEGLPPLPGTQYASNGGGGASDTSQFFTSGLSSSSSGGGGGGANSLLRNHHSLLQPISTFSSARANEMSPMSAGPQSGSHPNHYSSWDRIKAEGH